MPLPSSARQRNGITALAPETTVVIIRHASRKENTPHASDLEGDSIVLDASRLTKLRLVCKKWNKLIKTSPLLWNSFSPTEPLRNIKKILKYAGNTVPLTISHKYSPYAHDGISPDAVKFIFSQLPRTAGLHIALRKPTWEEARSAFESSKNASALEWLEIKVSHIKSGNFDWILTASSVFGHNLELKKLPPLPKLQELYLSGIKLPKRFSPLPSLVSLRLGSQGQPRRVEKLLEALCCMPALQSLRLDHCFPEERREDDEDEDDDSASVDEGSQTAKPDATVSLRSLRSVQIRDTSIGECATFLGSIKAHLTSLHVTYEERSQVQPERVSLMVKAALRLLARSLGTPQKMLVIKDLYEEDGNYGPHNLRISLSLRDDEGYERAAKKPSRRGVPGPEVEGPADDSLPLKLTFWKRFGDDETFFDNDPGEICRPFITAMAPLLADASKLLVDHEASHYYWTWDWISPVLQCELPAVQCVELIPCGYAPDKDKQSGGEYGNEDEDEDEDEDEYDDEEDEEDEEDFDPDNQEVLGQMEKPKCTFSRLVRALGDDWVVESPGVLKKET